MPPAPTRAHVAYGSGWIPRPDTSDCKISEHKTFEYKISEHKISEHKISEHKTSEHKTCEWQTCVATPMGITEHLAVNDRFGSAASNPARPPAPGHSKTSHKCRWFYRCRHGLQFDAPGCGAVSQQVRGSRFGVSLYPELATTDPAGRPPVAWPGLRERAGEPLSGPLCRPPNSVPGSASPLARPWRVVVVGQRSPRWADAAPSVA
jgi:hypothetical protein